MGYAPDASVYRMRLGDDYSDSTGRGRLRPLFQYDKSSSRGKVLAELSSERMQIQ